MKLRNSTLGKCCCHVLTGLMGVLGEYLKGEKSWKRRLRGTQSEILTTSFILEHSVFSGYPIIDMAQVTRRGSIL